MLKLINKWNLIKYNDLYSFTFTKQMIYNNYNKNNNIFKLITTICELFHTNIIV